MNKDELQERIKEVLPRCPICQAYSGYRLSGIANAYLHCLTCEAKWDLTPKGDWLGDKFREGTITHMRLEEAPDKYQEMIGKVYPFEYWQNLAQRSEEKVIISIAQGSEEKDEALAAQEFKEVSQSDKSELDTLAETRVNSEIQGEIVTTSEINETEVDLSGEFSWREASVHEGIITFECPGCKKTHSLKTTLFSSQSPNPAVGLMPTSQEILWGKEIGSMVLAFVVAVTFGVFVAVLVGFHIWIGIVCAVIFMILKPVFTPKFMKKLPVWIFKCNSCSKRTFIASDGTEAAIGELQANVGE